MRGFFVTKRNALLQALKPYWSTSGGRGGDDRAARAHRMWMVIDADGAIIVTIGDGKRHADGCPRRHEQDRPALFHP